MKGFWKDIGLPKDFLKASQILLNHLKKNKTQIDDFVIIENTKNFKGVNLIHKDTEISEDSLIGPYAVIHRGVKINSGCRVKSSVLMDDIELGNSVHIFDSILMKEIKVGSYSRI